MFSYTSGRERGNVMIYILIAIALFGGLTLSLSRQNQQADGQSLSEEEIAFQVNEVMTYAGTVANVIDQMNTIGTQYSDLVFINPGSANFDSLTPQFNIYHNSGGGLTKAVINKKIFTGSGTNPPAGWYIGRFNTVEGTPTTAHDVIVTAHLINQPLCAALNKKLTGNATIPTLGANPAYYLIAGTHHSLGNGTFTKAICPTCFEKPALCVSNTGGTAWSFYSLVGVQ